MNKATLTLELTYQQIAAVMAFLHNTPEEPFKAPTSPKPVPANQVPTNTPIKPPKASEKTSPPPCHGSKIKPLKVAPTAGKKVAMPTFGRTASQIEAFSEKEQERFAKKSEAQLLKEQKQADKNAAEELAEKEVKKILSQEEVITPTSKPIKPWEL